MAVYDAGTYNGIILRNNTTYCSFYIGEKHTPRYSERGNTKTLTQEWTLVASEPITQEEAISEASSFYRATFSNPRTVHIYGSSQQFTVSTFDVEHVEEQDIDRVWNIRIEWSQGTGTSGSGGSSTELPKIPYELNESWDTSGQTVHITEAIDQNIFFPDGSTATASDVPDFGYGIGYNDGKFDGCDVLRPAFSFTLHRRLSFGSDALKASYQQTIAELTGTVNNATYCGFAAGTVLFEGASASSNVLYEDGNYEYEDGVPVAWRPTIYFDVTFKFRCSPNYPNRSLQVGDIDVSKQGHDYFWSYFEKVDDNNTGVTFDEQKAVVVSKVYPDSDFSLLNVFGEYDNGPPLPTGDDDSSGDSGSDEGSDESSSGGSE